MRAKHKVYISIVAKKEIHTNEGDFLLDDILEYLTFVRARGAERLDISLNYDNSILFEPYYERLETDEEYEVRLKEENSEEYTQYLRLKEKYEKNN